MLKFIKNLILFFKKRKSPTWQEHYEILSKVFLEGVQDGLKSKHGEIPCPLDRWPPDQIKKAYKKLKNLDK